MSCMAAAVVCPAPLSTLQSRLTAALHCGNLILDCERWILDNRDCRNGVADREQAHRTGFLATTSSSTSLSTSSTYSSLSQHACPVTRKLHRGVGRPGDAKVVEVSNGAVTFSTRRLRMSAGPLVGADNSS